MSMKLMPPFVWSLMIFTACLRISPVSSGGASSIDSSHTTTSPSTVAVMTSLESGMKSDCVYSPIPWRKSAASICGV